MNNRDETGRFLQGHKVNTYSEEQMLTFFHKYCQHRAAGKDKESFSREGCDFRTVERWANQSIVPTIRARLYEAETEGHAFWETLLIHVTFGISIEINAPTKDNPNRKHIVEPKFTRPHILMFLMKSKFRETYGRKPQNNTPSTDSVVTEIIDGNGNSTPACA